MPRKNSIKVYAENSYYHVYNRGVEKRIIFEDDQDYRVFLHLLKYYLSPTDLKNIKHPLSDFGSSLIIRPRPMENLYGKVELLAYCLMPNHYHLLIKQIPIDGMTKLLGRLSTTYSMYFNKRYERVGHLFQGIYKAILIDRDEYLLHISRYIHLNPLELTGVTPVNYPYSSYQYYTGEKHADWIKPEYILTYFEQSKKDHGLNKHSSYEKFVEEYYTPSENVIPQLMLD